MAGFESRHHVDVVRVVLGDDIAAGHAVAAEMARGARRRSDAARRLPDVNHLDAQLGRATAHDHVAALHGDRRQEDAVGQILQMVEIAADADFALDLFVVGGEVGVVDGPVLACAVDGAALEIAMAQAPGYSVPGHAFAAQAAAALAFKSSDAGPHGGDVAIREVERHSVGVESSAGVDLRAAFDHRDVDASAREMTSERSAGSAGADDEDVIDLLRHW